MQHQRFTTTLYYQHLVTFWKSEHLPSPSQSSSKPLKLFAGFDGQTPLYEIEDLLILEIELIQGIIPSRTMCFFLQHPFFTTQKPLFCVFDDIYLFDPLSNWKVEAKHPQKHLFNTKAPQNARNSCNN